MVKATKKRPYISVAAYLILSRLLLTLRPFAGLAVCIGKYRLSLLHRIAAVTATLYWGEMGEFLFPVAQYVGFYGAQFRNFADCEIAFAGDDRQFVVVAGF